MLNKNHSITLIFVSLLFFAATGKVFADVSAGLEQAKTSIISLIKKNNFTEAKVETQKLVADFSSYADLPETLYGIAKECESRLKLETEDNVDVPDAKSVYQQIMQNHPDSSYASKAKLGISRAEVMSLILYHNCDRAKEALDKLIADFSGNPDLPETLCDVAERYEWSSKLGEAKSVYQQIIKNYPDSSWASKAKLGIARSEVLSLIMLRNDKDYDRAKKALDKLIADFSGHPDLPETLCWIAERYEWFSRFEDAKSIYRKIIQDYSDSSWASRAKLSISRSDVMNLITLSKDFDGAKVAFDKMIADFPDQPDLQQTLCWIAERYEWSSRREDAKDVYQRVIQVNSGSSYASKAKLSIAKLEVLSLIALENYNGAEEALDKLVTDFARHLDLPRTEFLIGEEYCRKALQLENRGLNADAKEQYAKAIVIWERILTEFPNSSACQLAYNYSALCYRLLGEYEKAIEYYQKVVDVYPDYFMAWNAQFMVGYCYQKLSSTGAIPQEVADDKTRSAYQQVLHNYPNCEAAKAARNWLSKHPKRK